MKEVRAALGMGAPSPFVTILRILQPPRRKGHLDVD